MKKLVLLALFLLLGATAGQAQITESPVGSQFFLMFGCNDPSGSNTTYLFSRAAAAGCLTNENIGSETLIATPFNTTAIYMRCRNTNIAVGSTFTYTFRKDKQDTALSCSASNATGSECEVTASVFIPKNTNISVSVTEGGAGIDGGIHQCFVHLS